MHRTRTTADEMHALALEDLAAALTAAGLRIERSGKQLLRARLDDARFDLDVIPVAYATGSRIRKLVEEPRRDDRDPVIVADRVTARAKDRLTEAGWGWLDRRGHLRLRSPGLLLDTSVPSSTRDARVSGEPIRGRAGIAIAYRLLTHPAESISTTRSGLGFAPSTISEALTRLRHAGLVDGEGHAVVPELFWALAERWTPDRTWLTEEPDPATLDNQGWCMSGTVAAAALGAPVVSTSSKPDLYVPSAVAATIAARRHGVVRDATVAAASIAVAPAPEVTAKTRKLAEQPWPLAHPVAVALDLAQDRARGREILEDWRPPERVW